MSAPVSLNVSTYFADFCTHAVPAQCTVGLALIFDWLKRPLKQTSVCVSVEQTDPPPLTVLETLLRLWRTISIIIYAGSAFLVICLLVVIVVYAVHCKYVQHAAYATHCWVVFKFVTCVIVIVSMNFVSRSMCPSWTLVLGIGKCMTVGQGRSHV